MKSNALQLYKHFCNMVENPQGVDSAERTMVRNNAVKNKAMWEKRFKTAKKYRTDLELQRFLGNVEETPKEEPKEEVKKETKDGKKSKG